jgi:hypothetical protein
VHIVQRVLTYSIFFQLKNMLANELKLRVSSVYMTQPALNKRVRDISTCEQYRIEAAVRPRCGTLLPRSK